MMDNRFRYDLTAFWMETDDMQIATTDVRDGIPQGSESTNAGKQRVRGFEFGLTSAITDRLTVNFNGASMDGVMVEFEGAGCTPAEFAVADTGPCISTAESIALVGDDSAEGLIDRSGEEAPRTPDWKFALEVDYWYPLFNNYKAMFNYNIAYSDGYIDNVEDFDKMIKWNTHMDINLNVGFGDINDVWRVSFWGRNLLEASTSYNEEFDVELDGLATENLSSADFFTYGVQLQYNFR
jgi:outer membrane receptor protein involved in Fe transport